MRWNKTTYRKSDVRIVKVFLWFPRRIQNEVRWLERATIKQKYESCYIGDGVYAHSWQDIEWIDVEEENLKRDCSRFDKCGIKSDYIGCWDCLAYSKKEEK